MRLGLFPLPTDATRVQDVIADAEQAEQLGLDSF